MFSSKDLLCCMTIMFKNAYRGSKNQLGPSKSYRIWQGLGVVGPTWACCTHPYLAFPELKSVTFRSNDNDLIDDPRLAVTFTIKLYDKP